MQGSSHKTIGVGVALACAYVGMETGNAALCAAAVTAPLGAMLPDIDHDRSKLGARRKEAVDSIKRITKVAGVGGFLLTTGMQIYTYGFTLMALISTAVIWVPLIACILLATSDTIKKKIAFFSKHRGIMHTLWPVIGMMYGSYVIEVTFFQSLILGLSLGYLSHLLADCETVMGCPLFWPLIKGNIKGKVRTGTAWEKIVMLIDLALIGAIAILLSRR